jgi:RNA polymerase sigma factor (sigma-70 family)
VELLAAEAPGPETVLASQRSLLAGCLDKVAGRSRELLELRYVEGLTPPLIAKRMNWSVGAVNVGLSRARQFLRDCARRKTAAGEN